MLVHLVNKKNRRRGIANLQETAGSMDKQVNKSSKSLLFSTKNLLLGIALILSLISLYFLSRYNYLLFHGTIEVFTIVISIVIFTIAWNSRKTMDNNYLAFIGIAFLFIGGLDLLHTLAYRGMGVFPEVGANLATQLWIATRYMFAFSMFIPVVFIRRKTKSIAVLVGYSIVTSLVVLSIFYWNIFPQAFVDNVGLTAFKIGSEYVISVILALSMVLLYRNRAQFSDSVFKWLMLGMTLAIATEMMFTLYTDVIGITNMLGHLLDLFSFYLIYKALIETGFSKPYNLMFHNLKQSELSLTKQASELTQSNQRLETEIAEHKKTEQELTYSKRLLENVFDSMYEGVFILDKKGQVIDFNDAFARINKFKDKQDVLKSINSLGTIFRAYHLDGSFIPVEEWPATKALQGQSGTDEIYIVERADLGIQWITSNSYGPLLNERGDIIGAIQTLYDITERKKAEDALKQRTETLEQTQKKLEENACLLEEYSNQMEELANQRLERLKDAERLAAVGATAGMVGHDIRNPLQSITGDLYLAKTEADGLPDSEAKKNILESLAETQKNIEYINKIVQDLQDYARPLNPKSEESDLKNVFEKLIMKNGLPENIKVSIKIADDSRLIKVDSYYLNRILYNLVTNAVQAMPKGGKLTISAHKEANDTIISVKDTGIGIPKDVQSKMFTVMFTTKSKGQGFGLPVVKRMAESLGGTVSFESQEGKGTTFIILLPIKG